jgi:hypothetical protein
MREEKRTEPFLSGVFRHAKEDRIEGGVEEAREWANHDQDFKADHEIEDDGAAQNCLGLAHVGTSRGAGLASAPLSSCRFTWLGSLADS